MNGSLTARELGRNGPPLPPSYEDLRLINESLKKEIESRMVSEVFHLD